LLDIEPKLEITRHSGGDGVGKLASWPEILIASEQGKVPTRTRRLILLWRICALYLSQDSRVSTEPRKSTATHSLSIG